MACKLQNYQRRWLCNNHLNVLIWDEISMSSLRIFHIVDQLHQKVRSDSLPFGGIQVILGGEFLQLKPIPSMLDGGEPIYKSVLFDKVFQHRVVLEKIMRQSELEEDFKNLWTVYEWEYAMITQRHIFVVCQDPVLILETMHHRLSISFSRNYL